MCVCDWLKVPCWIVLFEHPHYSECPQGSPLLISVSLTDRENHAVIMFKPTTSRGRGAKSPLSL